VIDQKQDLIMYVEVLRCVWFCTCMDW